MWRGDVVSSPNGAQGRAPAKIVFGVLWLLNICNYWMSHVLLTVLVCCVLGVQLVL